MSSKHISRLREKDGMQKNDPEHSSEDEVEHPSNISRNFDVLGEESDSSSLSTSESEDETLKEEKTIAIPTKKGARKKSAANKLDDLLSADDGKTTSDLPNRFSYDVLNVDPNDLDLDSLMRHRFGTSISVEHSGQSRRQHGSRKSLKNKRLVFGQPKDDWTRPRTYIGGGICQTNSVICNSSCSENWYKFQWSEDYKKLQARYENVQNTGDVNMLVMFLAENHHHLDGLLQLAMVFARTAQMDRASDLIKRCIYYIECSQVESFKPYDSRQACRMNINERENRIYFQVLFRYMQICCMMGCPIIASNIGKVLLSLCPEEDPLAILLSLDHYLLLAGKYANITEFCEPVVLSKFLPATQYTTTDNTSFPVDILPSINYQTMADFLPNWSFSLALSSFLTRDSSNDGLGKSTTELMSALTKWPFMIESLVELIDIPESRVDALQSKVFKHFTKTSSSSHQIFTIFASIYRIRGEKSVWKRDDVAAWVLQTLKSLDRLLQENNIDEVIASTERHLAKVSMSEFVIRYCKVDVDDFREEYQRLPPDANPLDPRFADPAILAGRAIPMPVQIEQRNFNVNQLDRGTIMAQIRNLREAGLVEEADALERQMRNAGQNRMEVVDTRGNMDPSLPLMQLFLGLLMPWNSFDTSRSTYRPNDR